MTRISIKGREYTALTVKDSHVRRSQQFRNNLLEQFKKIGLTDDDVEISMEAAAFRKAPASAAWYFQGRHLYYSYGQRTNFAENLYVVWNVIEKEIQSLIAQERTIEEFMDMFKEDPDVEKAREEARAILGLAADTRDLDAINKAYKDLAVQHHPDKEDGDVETFKRINNAHKTLKRELS